MDDDTLIILKRSTFCFVSSRFMMCSSLNVQNKIFLNTLSLIMRSLNLQVDRFYFFYEINVPKIDLLKMFVYFHFV